MPHEPTLIEHVADFVHRLSYDDLDSESIELAGWLVFDTIGTALGGFQRPLGRRAAAYGVQRGGEGPSTVLGLGRRTSMLEATFANATMAKILGMDDSHRQAGHIAAAVVPAVLAVGEAHNTSGREAVVAIVAAYEVAVRLGCAVRTELRRRGQDLKGVIGPIASAAAAGRCAGLNTVELANAMALAVDLAGGTEQYVYEGRACDTKDLIAGFAARNGVWAVDLARTGFHGAMGALDGPYGFMRAFGDGDVPTFDDLGTRLAIGETAFKPHGGCRHTHQAVDAVQHLLSQSRLALSSIEHIDVHTYRYALEPQFRVDPDPPGRDVAGLSIRVATAIALRQGSAWPADYDYWDEPEVRRLRHVIDIHVEPAIERDYPNRNGCRVVVGLSDGTSIDSEVEYAKGEPEWRMTNAELCDKFAVLAPDLPRWQVDELYAYCNKLAQVPSIAQVTGMLS